jgi:hypothetical protein
MEFLCEQLETQPDVLGLENSIPLHEELLVKIGEGLQRRA